MRSRVEFWGVKITLTANAKTADGTPVEMTSDWSAACRVTKGEIGGEVVANPTMTISGTKALGVIDTSEAGWEPGLYYYDFRITDDLGTDSWSNPVSLLLKNRNSPSS